jgi:hypothetical protein
MPAGDVIPHLGGVPENSLDPAADESKEFIRWPTCFTKTDCADRKCVVSHERPAGVGGG